MKLKSLDWAEIKRLALLVIGCIACINVTDALAPIRTIKNFRVGFVLTFAWTYFFFGVE